MRSSLPRWVRRLWMKWDLWRYRGEGPDPFRKDPYLTTNLEMNQEYIDSRMKENQERRLHPFEVKVWLLTKE